MEAQATGDIDFGFGLRPPMQGFNQALGDFGFGGIDITEEDIVPAKLFSWLSAGPDRHHHNN